MRTRRCFQPVLDSMPTRIAPSAVGGFVSPILLAAAVAPLQSLHPICMPADTEMPETGPSTPIKPPPK
jgi:hypothetical protein